MSSLHGLAGGFRAVIRNKSGILRYYFAAAKYSDGLLIKKMKYPSIP
jgi:hypothetical protein